MLADDGPTARTHARSTEQFAAPLPDAEVMGLWRSVCRYRARWRVQGHKPAWLARQAALGLQSSSVWCVKASLFLDISNEQAKPWADLGVSPGAPGIGGFGGAKVGGAKTLGRKVRHCPQYRDRGSYRALVRSSVRQ